MKRISLIFLTLSLFLLAGCGGTLDIGVAPEDSPETPTPPVPTGEPATHIPLTSYSDDQYGYVLPVPMDAVVEEIEDSGANATGFSRPSDGFSVLVQVHDDLPADIREPAGLLRYILATETLPTEVTPLDGGTLSGGWMALPRTPGQVCAETVSVSAAYLGAGRAFTLLISSDAPDRCNAATLPETQAILEGFRVDAAAIAMMTPTPVPTAPSQIAYLREGNVWLWTEGIGRFTLFEEQGAEGPVRLHPEGRWVAFTRDGHLWVVSADGNDERALTDDNTFAGYRLGEGAAVEAVGFRPYQVAWVAGGDLLLFNTRVLLVGPGLLLSNDLWQVDVASGEVTNLLQPGAGGDFVLSPDGSKIALVRPDAVEIANAEGGDRNRLLEYDPVLTYSEYQYYAEPIWSPDGSALRVAIPPADPMASPGQSTSIWHLTLSGNAARLMGEIPAVALPPGANVAISPDLSHVAYLRVREEGTGRFDLLLAPLGDGVGEPVIYAEDVEQIDGWSPDGETFLFTPAFDGTRRLLLGQPGGVPQPVGDPASAVIDGQWAGPEQEDLVYLQQVDDGWELWLADAQGENRVLDTVSGPPPAFDTR